MVVHKVNKQLRGSIQQSILHPHVGFSCIVTEEALCSYVQTRERIKALSGKALINMYSKDERQRSKIREDRDRRSKLRDRICTRNVRRVLSQL